MSYSRLPDIRTALASVACSVVLLLSSPAAAQSKVGHQWLTSGLTVSPTLVHDATGPQAGVDKASIGGGLRLRLGFQHVVARPFVMAAEVELGQHYQRASRISPDGQSDASAQFAWQAGLVGRWVPLGELTGPALGVGIHSFRARFPEAPVQSLAGDVRFGWYLWQQRSFVLAEIGYAIPFLEGVDAPATFTEDQPSIVDQNWTMHRFSIGFSYGF